MCVQTEDIVKPNEEYIIRGEGLPKDEYRCGDLLIRFNIIFPDSLSKEKKTLYYKILPVVSSEVSFSKIMILKFLKTLEKE